MAWRIGRRLFVKSAAMAGVAAAVVPSGVCVFAASPPEMPKYLKGYEDLWQRDPLKASVEWFRNAPFGFFMHYGLNAITEVHTWYMYGKYYDEKGAVQQRAPVPISKFEKKYKDGRTYPAVKKCIELGHGFDASRLNKGGIDRTIETE